MSSLATSRGVSLSSVKDRPAFSTDDAGVVSEARGSRSTANEMATPLRAMGAYTRGSAPVSVASGRDVSARAPPIVPLAATRASASLPELIV